MTSAWTTTPKPSPWPIRPSRSRCCSSLSAEGPDTVEAHEQRKGSDLPRTVGAHEPREAAIDCEAVAKPEIQVYQARRHYPCYPRFAASRCLALPRAARELLPW